MNIQINGLDYNVVDEGNGDHAFVLLHYFGGNGETWREVIRALGPDVRVVAPDLSGFGATPTTETAYTVDQYAADVLALIEALDLRSYTLVGHSMGGKVALALAAQQPSGLQQLVLLAPSPPSPEPMEPKERQRMLRSHGDRAATEQTITTIAANTLPANLFTQAVEENLAVSETAWRGWLEGGSTEDISEHVGQINVPVTVLVGERDPVISQLLITSEITPRLTGTTVRVITLPEVGHLLPYEAPTDVAETLLHAAAEQRPTVREDI